MSERKPYPSDISDARWALIEPTLTAWRQARLDRRPTGLSENAVGIQLLNDVKAIHPTITKAWVDTGFENATVEHGARLGIGVEVVNRNPDIRGFQVVKRRWVVERSLGWIMLRRRLTRDYETLPTSSESMIYIASIDPNLASNLLEHK